MSGKLPISGLLLHLWFWWFSIDLLKYQEVWPQLHPPVHLDFHHIFLAVAIVPLWPYAYVYILTWLFYMYVYILIWLLYIYIHMHEYTIYDIIWILYRNTLYIYIYMHAYHTIYRDYLYTGSTFSPISHPASLHLTCLGSAAVTAESFRVKLQASSMGLVSKPRE